MTKPAVPLHQPIPIGNVVRAPFVRLPAPATMFAARAARLLQLAETHDLRAYLLFLAGLSEAQHRLQDGLAAPDAPEAGALKRAGEYAMPPIDRGAASTDPVLASTLERFLSLARDVAKPEAAAAALDRVGSVGVEQQREMFQSVLDNAIPADRIAEHIYVVAALQVHFARLAGALDAASLVPVGDGACPACGSPPSASMIVGWPSAHGARYCGCSLCGTLWNYVRIKCALCGSTKGITYKEIEDGPETIKAEACGNCHGYLKILHQHKDPSLDIVADDVASLALDMLMRESGFRRGGVNPYLTGY
jgi:FdhE protein